MHTLVGAGVAHMSSTTCGHSAADWIRTTGAFRWKPASGWRTTPRSSRP